MQIFFQLRQDENTQPYVATTTGLIEKKRCNENREILR